MADAFEEKAGFVAFEEMAGFAAFVEMAEVFVAVQNFVVSLASDFQY